jgi:hypothetical protein
MKEKIHQAKLYFFIMFFLISLINCQQKVKKNKSVEEKHSSQPKSKPASSFADSLIISSAAAISFEPDSIQLQKIKSITDSNEFQTMVHEYFFQQRNATLFLQQHWPHVKILSAKNFRYLIFRNQRQTIEVVDLDKIPDFFGMYFFEPGKNPQRIDMMSIDTEAPNYFSK